MKTENLPTIGEQEKFYGYIIGLGMQPSSNIIGAEPPSVLYAMFEYSSECQVWIVPDSDLFEILSHFLCDNAWAANEGLYGNAKLWIGKRDGKWWADLP